MHALRRLTTLAAAAAAAVVVCPSPSASAADSWAVPEDATVVVRGHGYGHGHGMSQHGAEGAARQGLTHQRILRFYYPGTRLGEARGRLRVLLTADTDADLVVRPRPGLTVRDTAGGARVELPKNGARAWRLKEVAGGTRVSFRDGHWRRWRTLRGSGELAAGGQPVTVVTPGGESAYRGRLRLTEGDTVNLVSLESYLRGVVPLEIPALWSDEAVQAQAVAARTYAAYERAHPRARHYDICDTTSCQVYGGAGAEHPASDEAIAATRRQVVLADGAPAFTQFSSSSGGWTSAGSMPYLAAREDPYDDWPGNTVHDWAVRLSDETLERTWPGIGELRRITVTERDGNGDWGGRVRSLTLVGSAGKVVVSGDGFRSALGLRSTYLTFRVR